MFNFKSTKLVLNLNNIKQRLAGRKAAARITVTEEVDWWFYQEFGTATHFNSDHIQMPQGIVQADFPGTTSPDGYTISAKNGGMLRLPITSEYPDEWRGPSVHHPGVSPKAFIRRILPDIQKTSSDAVATALVRGGYNIDAVQEALMTDVMPAILTQICDSMAEQLKDSTDRDTPGKLGAADPASVFRSAATIVDSSG